MRKVVMVTAFVVLAYGQKVHSGNGCTEHIGARIKRTATSTLAALLVLLNAQAAFKPGVHPLLFTQIALRRSVWPQRCSGFLALDSDPADKFTEVDMKKLQWFAAREKARNDNSTASLAELAAAEDALFAEQLNNPSSLTNTAMVDVRKNDEELDTRPTDFAYWCTPTSDEDLEKWQFKKLAEETKRLKNAEAVLFNRTAGVELDENDETADMRRAELREELDKILAGKAAAIAGEDFAAAQTFKEREAECQAQLVAIQEARDEFLAMRDAVVDLGKSMFKGNLRAEFILLEVLTNMQGSFVAQLADETLRNAWSSQNEVAIKVSKKLFVARSHLRDGFPPLALVIYDSLCNQTQHPQSDATPLWAEAWRLRAKCLVRMEKIESAERSFETALQLNPRCYPILMDFAEFLLLVDKKASAGDAAAVSLSDPRKRARDLLDNALRLNPRLQARVEYWIRTCNL